MTIHPLLTKILEDPTAPCLLAQAQTALHDEQRRRTRFSENEKVEFINGEIVLHSPVKRRHNAATLLLDRLMSTYADRHDSGFVGIEKIMVSLSRNDYEPDLCYFRRKVAAGFTADQMRFPAPDWIVEVVSASTEARDRGVKFVDYAAHGVREYWLIDPEAETIEQYVLQGGAYELHRKQREGALQSVAPAAFAVPVRAVFDAAENLHALGGLLSR
ncbi:MAG: Uma2 family endonuclease [Catalinimonas sp.]